MNYTSNTTENTYSSIDEIPIWNWEKIYETADLKYLFKDLKGVATDELTELWDDLQQQYFDEFGFDYSFEERLRIKKKLAEHTLDYIITKDRFILNFIRFAEIELEALEKEKTTSFYEAKDTVEKYKGFRIDPRQVTVIEWGYALKNMSKHGGKAD